MKTRSIVCLLAVVLFASACQRPAPAPARAVRPVEVAVAETRDVPLYIDEIGRCEPVARVMVQPQVSGMLLSANVTDGTDVKTGDLLFTIDPRPFQAVLDSAKSKLGEVQAKAAYDLAQLQRNQKLSDRNVVSPQDLDNARTLELSSQAAMLGARANVESAAINLDYCSIRSPIDGRTGHRLVDPGNIVTANTTNLIEIQTQTPIYVDFSIPEDQLPEVRERLAAGTLSVVASYPQDPLKSREGKLIFMDSGINKGTGTVLLRALVENDDRLFWPGQFVQVRLILESIKDAVLVPREAVQAGADGPYLFVVAPDSSVSVREIKTGQRQGDSVVVTDALAAGETVVVTGQLGLSEGMTVKPVQPSTNP